MLDMGFINDIRKIVAKLPAQRQTLLFSATMPADIADLARAMLKDPAKVAVTPVATTAERIAQRVIHLDRAAKPGRARRHSARGGGGPRPDLHPHQAWRRQGGPRACPRRHRRRGDPRQQVAEPARAHAGGVPQPAASAPWSRPTSPRAASTSTASAMWSTSTCRTFRKATSTASAAPRAPAPRASPSRWSAPTRCRILRDIQKLIRMEIPATGEHGPCRLAGPQQASSSRPAAATTPQYQARTARPRLRGRTGQSPTPQGTPARQRRIPGARWPKPAGQEQHRQGSRAPQPAKPLHPTGSAPGRPHPADRRRLFGVAFMQPR